MTPPVPYRPAPRASLPAALCLLGAFIFCLFGFVIFPSLLWIERRVAAMRTWPETTAEIVSANVVANHRMYSPTRYQHACTYRYTVAGQVYLGERTTAGGPRPMWSSAEAAAAALPPPGTTVAIRYNPAAPADSVMQILHTSERANRGYRLFALGMAAAGATAALLAGRAWRQSRQREARASHR